MYIGANNEIELQVESVDQEQGRISPPYAYTALQQRLWLQLISTVELSRFAAAWVGVSPRVL